MLEKTLESTLDNKEIKPINPKGNQLWLFIEFIEIRYSLDSESEAPIFWPPNAKSWLIGKDPDAAKDGGQEEKGVTEDGITDSMNMSLSKLQDIGKNGGAWHAAVHGVPKSPTWLSNWTTTNADFKINNNFFLALWICHTIVL